MTKEWKLKAQVVNAGIRKGNDQITPTVVNDHCAGSDGGRSLTHIHTYLHTPEEKKQEEEMSK